MSAIIAGPAKTIAASGIRLPMVVKIMMCCFEALKPDIDYEMKARLVQKK